MIQISADVYEAHADIWGRLAEECMKVFHQIVLLGILEPAEEPIYTRIFTAKGTVPGHVTCL